MTAHARPRRPVRSRAVDILMAGAGVATIVFGAWPTLIAAGVVAACLAGAIAVDWHAARRARPARHLHAVPDRAPVQILRPPVDSGGAA